MSLGRTLDVNVTIIHKMSFHGIFLFFLISVVYQTLYCQNPDKILIRPILVLFWSGKSRPKQDQQETYSGRCLLGVRTDNQGNQNWVCWLETFQRSTETRKATGLTSLLVNSREINQVTPKCQMCFIDKFYKKRSKAEQVNITVELYIFRIVLVSNFSLN